MNIAKLMHEDVKSCRPQDTLDTAAKLMWDYDIGALPVVDAASRVVGMITDRDICMAAYTKGSRLADLRVETAMAKEVIACRPNDDVTTARGLMADNKLRRLPVIDANDHLVGMLTIKDLAHAVEHRIKNGVGGEDVAVTLAAICTPRPAAAPLKRV